MPPRSTFVADLQDDARRVVYAIWSGVGIVLISLVGWIGFRQHLASAAALIGIALIVAGVAVINLLSKSVPHITPAMSLDTASANDRLEAARELVRVIFEQEEEALKNPPVPRKTGIKKMRTKYSRICLKNHRKLIKNL